MAEWTLVPGAKIKRTELHDQFGGSRQGGISPSAQTANVFIFSDSESGEQHGYIDSWKEDGCFHYTGEGQRGDQRMVGGNRAILNASQDGRSLRVFEGSGGVVEYKGLFALDRDQRWYEADAPETGYGPVRSVIVFRLRPADTAPARPSGVSVVPGDTVVLSVAVEDMYTEKTVVDPSREPYEAERRESALVQRFKQYMESKGDLVIAVAGCVAQQEGERLLQRMPHLDVVVGPDNIAELPGLIAHVREGAPPLARTVFDLEAPRFLRARPSAAEREVTSFVTVMKGCDERCTYCIVPYTRGPERYRPAQEIVDEIALLVERGTREIYLLGQTVNSWHSRGAGEGESEFPALLWRIARELPGLARLRYTSPHPRHLNEALIAAHAELALLPRHVHLPVQSGSDRVLKRMLRRYSAAEYRRRVDALRARVPGLTLSTDVIVGFPGETEQDFEATLALVREVGFVSLFGFKYSPRPYTPALKLEDDVPEQVKDERLQRLFATSEALQRAHLARCVGTRVTVLVESRDPARPGRFSGRSQRNELVHVDVASGKDPRGNLLEVDVVEAFKHSLRGAACEPWRAPEGTEAVAARAPDPGQHASHSPEQAAALAGADAPQAADALVGVQRARVRLPLASARWH